MRTLSANGTESARPSTVVAATAILFVEALGMLGVAGFLAVATFGDPVEHLAGGLVLVLISVAAAFFLAQAGRALWRGRAWSRSAAVVWQVLQIGVALGTFNGGEGPVPLALLLASLGVACMALVLRRSVSEWLSRESRTER